MNKKYLTFEEFISLVGIGSTLGYSILRNSNPPYAFKVGKLWRIDLKKLEEYLSDVEQGFCTLKGEKYYD